MTLRITLVAVFAALALTAADSEGWAGGGTPITFCGQVVTTSAFLSQTFYCPGSDGVVVGAAGITIDLKGFRLRGDRSPGQRGIVDAGWDGVTIKNGVVRNFDYGVAVYNGSDAVRISNMVVSGNASDGIFAQGDSLSVKSSTTSGNGFFGIRASSPSAVVQSSTASGNHGAGISVAGVGDSVSVKSSIASGNRGLGIAVSGPGAKVLSSIASGNGLDGISVVSEGASIKANRADANGFLNGASDLSGHGVTVMSSSTPPIGTNVARGNDSLADCTPPSLC